MAVKISVLCVISAFEWSLNRCIQEGHAVAEKPHDAVVKFDTYWNVQWHRPVFLVIALHLVHCYCPPCAICRCLVDWLIYSWQSLVYSFQYVDKWYKSSDKPSFQMARRLIHEEGLLCGMWRLLCSSRIVFQVYCSLLLSISKGSFINVVKQMNLIVTARVRTILVLGYWVLGNIHRYWIVLVLGDIFCCSDTQYNTNQTAVGTVHMPVNDYLVSLMTCTLTDAIVWTPCWYARRRR